MRIQLLGPVRAWREGVELAMGSGRRTAVFSVLALAANRAVSREQLIAAVWGGEPPDSATGNVYTYVSALRKTLEPGRRQWATGQFLTSGGGSYRLRLPREAIDAHRFEELREESRRHRADNDRPAELSTLVQALRLWRGEALHGVPGPYAEAQRRRLTELHVTTAQRHAGLLIELGRHDEAIAELRRLVELYPLHENLNSLLMSALHGTGRRVEALTAYGRLSSLTRQRTGGKPGSAIRALHSRIASDGRPAPVRSGPRPTAPVFVGRGAELRLLRKAVAQVRAGRGGGIWLQGTPGMGKSALLSAALAGDASAGCRIGWGAGDELARHIPLGALRECLESAFADQDQDQDQSLAEEFRTAAGSARTGANIDAEQRAVAAIGRAAAAGPLILVLDDLERVDDATLRVWAALHRLTGDVPLLLIGAGQPVTADSRLAALRAGHPHEIRLRELGPAEAVTLIRTVALEPPEPQVLRELLADAGGSPYYLRQLAASSSRGSTAPGGLPAETTAAVAARLEPFTEETRQVLRAVAFLDASHTTAGAPAGCTIDEVAAVTGRPAEELLRALAPARRAGVLPETGPRLALRHRIVGRVLHQVTPASLRVMLHRSFAEKIAAAGGPPERVVTQLLAGPVPLDGWPSRWLDEHVEDLGARAPGLAVAVLRRARAQYTIEHDTRVALTAWLARLLFRSNRNAVAEADWVAVRTEDAALAAEMRWIVAAAHGRREQFRPKPPAGG
ncbi:BTAD domain-containing putative transcriptional regulator [Rhizomonospora bruguierae]|uniref:BTAD domain-containing putative transcriptional regulator n=1 Tax=Rhizomonospora bruguierae TaxID=1581705 RepID=UPI001BCAD4C4|nr:BTAD domain-containing putative transcriptional regulator [Micromonospora sp. NBRC 107566]